MSNKNTFKFLKVLMLIIGLVLIASPFFTSAQNVQTVYADALPTSSPAISIEKMHIDVNVHENGVLTVSQQFKVQFLKSGLTEVMYYLPYTGSIYRSENSKIKDKLYLAKVSNYGFESLSSNLNEELNYYTDSDNAGDNNVAFGIKNTHGFFEKDSIREYRLFYDYDMRNKGTKEYDEVYFNLLGYNTPFEVKNITFKITFPKDVDFATNTPLFYYGTAGSRSTLDEGDYIIDGKTIKCETPFTLSANNALTLRQVLPKGYIKIPTIGFDWVVLYFVFTLVLVAVVIGVSIANCQRHEVVCPVEVVPPENMSPDMAEIYYKHKFTNKNLGAIIIYFANKGFLKVKLDENKNPVSLIKIKNPPDSFDSKLASLFNIIFSISSVRTLESGEQSVDLDSLNSELFYTGYTNLKHLREAKIDSKLFEEKENKIIKTMRFIPLLSTVVLFVSMLFQSILYLGFVNIQALLLPIMILGFIIPVVILAQTNKMPSSFLIPWLVITGIITYAMYFTSLMVIFDPYRLTLIGIVISITVSLLRFKPKYTENTAALRGRVLGLRNYIKMVEKDKLEMMVRENPHYYFDILPFAYVLDVSNIWIDKFKDIVILPSEWVEYNGTEVFTGIACISMCNAINNSASRSIKEAMARNASSSSFGGGGFSGGGGGGFSGGGGGGGSFGAR